MATKAIAIEKEIAKIVHELSLGQKKTMLAVLQSFEGKQEQWEELSDEQMVAIGEAEFKLNWRKYFKNKFEIPQWLKS